MTNALTGLVGSHLVVTTITRADIEAQNVVPALASLNKLVASKQALDASNGTISLMVSGYDDDPRELYVIPEVRQYFHVLDDQFPYWFHVCARIDHTLRLLLMMLVEIEQVPQSPESSSAEARFSNDDLHLFLLHHIQTMNTLHTRHGFDEETSAKIGELVISYFESLIS